MKQILQLEELAQFILGILGLYFLPFHFGWWLWIILFLSPDLMMFGFLVNTKVGAVAYNIGHHKGIAITIAIFGFYMQNNYLLLIGVILFAHAAFDRIMGFGLKYGDGFKHTHLDWYDAKVLKAQGL